MKRINFRRFLSLFALIAMMACMFSFTASAASHDPRQSVVLISTEDGHGTGFAVGKPGEPVRYIVTCYHVVENGGLIRVVFDGAASNALVASVFDYNAAKDIAILRLSSPTEDRVPAVVRPSDMVDVTDITESYHAFGYPYDDYSDVNYLNQDSIIKTVGGISSVVNMNSQDFYSHDAQTTFGNSGGPLTNSKGEVVGICAKIGTLGLETGDKRNFAIIIDDLLAMPSVQQGKVHVEVVGGFPWLLVLIIGGAVILIGVIVLVLILVLRKKPEPELVSNPGPFNPPVEPPVAGARLIVTGGNLHGRKYNLSGSVRIGRDASKCTIVYPVATQGVSGLHCEVTFDGNVCYVKDLGSSYGTFTGAGVKLAKDVPVMLRSGDTFYLASPENTFEVRF